MARNSDMQDSLVDTSLRQNDCPFDGEIDLESLVDTEVKPKHQKRKKAAAGPSPTCPHCFKFLLNPEKMRRHVASCCQRRAEHHIKLTIRLSSDKDKVEITESNN